MKKLITILIILTTLSFASVTRLYIGDLDGQFMAGVDTRIDISSFYIGGDVRTVIRKTVINEEDRVIGFMPDRTDYKFMMGINFGENKALEYSHTCYHRVISTTDLSFYTNNVKIVNTDSITYKVFF